MNKDDYKEMSEKFLSAFNICWNSTLDTLMYNQIQLTQGNRLRPFIAFGAFLYGKKTLEITRDEYFEIADITTCVELIHKASLIFDDYIDQDSSRHGNITFHKEFGDSTAIMFGLNIVGEAIKKLYLICKNYSDEHSINKYGFPLFLETVCNMSLGELKELSLDSLTQYNTEIIKNIISLETSKIIQTSLLLGYYASNNNCKEIAQTFENLGYQCGYVFQLMNDMEAFCNSNKNISHKGALNTDFSKNKKNIVVSYLYELLSTPERETLSEAKGKELDTLLIDYFKYYQLKDSLMKEVDIIYKKIIDEISVLSKKADFNEWNKCFSFFIETVVSECKSRLSN